MVLQKQRLRQLSKVSTWKHERPRFVILLKTVFTVFSLKICICMLTKSNNPTTFANRSAKRMDHWSTKSKCRLDSLFDVFVKWHNRHIWVSEKMHPKPVPVWSALWSGGILVPFFLEHWAGYALTVNGEPYCNVSTQFFVPQLEELLLETYGFSRKVLYAISSVKYWQSSMNFLLSVSFLILVTRTDRHDSSPMDFFLWGFLKF